jgi:hypothetical protein
MIMRLKNQVVEEYLDTDSGELKTKVTSKTFAVKTKTDGFYMTFFENLASFFKINSAKEIFILVELCSRAEYSTGKVMIVSALKKELLEKFDTSDSYFTACLKDLCEKGLLKKLGTGYYQINPLIFWKGDTKERARMLEKGSKHTVTIEFE